MNLRNLLLFIFINAGLSYVILYLLGIAEDPTYYFLVVLSCFFAYILFYLLWDKKHIPFSDRGPEINYDDRVPNVYDVLDLWIQQQKSFISGPLRDYPTSLEQINIDHQQPGDLFEVEADVLYYIIDYTSHEVPWMSISTIQFFDQPVPVEIPDYFVNRVDEFPLNTSIQQVECYDCLGRGIVRCGRCGGDGRVSCSSCGGSGSRSRSRTDSDGHIEWVREDCPWCFNGTDTCGRCGGSGTVTCGRCEGEGLLGEFQSENWHFIHEIKTEVVALDDDGDVEEATILDLPNSEAKELNYLQNDNYKSYLLERLDLPIYQELEKRVEDIQQKIDQLPDVQMQKFSFRSMPRLIIDVTYKAAPYHLVSRGFLPLPPKISDLPTVKLSWQKVLLGLLSPLTTIILSFYFT